jgi:hypothetical protein
MTRLRRFAPTAPSEWPWNGWPNAGGTAGWMLVEQVAEWRGMGIHTRRFAISRRSYGPRYLEAVAKLLAVNAARAPHNMKRTC